jgi:protein SCO1/2
MAGCWGENAYIVEGTVLDVRAPNEVVVDHERIEGLMGPMVMSFDVADPQMTKELKRGDRIIARLMMLEEGPELDKIRVTGHSALPAPKPPAGPVPVRVGEVLPRVEVSMHSGETWVLGEGQGKPTVLTYLYTTCPFPEFCPASILRLQSLQQAVGPDVRLVALTIDPAGDTLETLATFAETVGAKADRWQFARITGEPFRDLAMHGGLSMMEDGGEVLHSLRWLVMDAEGRLIERYDDNNWPEARVVQQLRTGEPKAPSGNSGTLTPKEPKPE